MIQTAITKFRAARARISNRGGFSFAELIIVVLISTMLIAGIYTVLITGKTTWEINRDRVEVQQEVRKGLDWIRKDVRQAGVLTGVPADGTWYTSIVVTTPSGVSSGAVTWNPTVQYTVSGGQLIRTTGGVTNRVIALRMNTVRFRRTAANPSVVQISLTGQKSTPQHGLVSMTITTQERMRNI